MNSLLNTLTEDDQIEFQYKFNLDERVARAILTCCSTLEQAEDIAESQNVEEDPQLALDIWEISTSNGAIDPTSLKWGTVYLSDVIRTEEDFEKTDRDLRFDDASESIYEWDDKAKAYVFVGSYLAYGIDKKWSEAKQVDAFLRAEDLNY